MELLTSDAVLIAADEKADSYKFYDNSDKLDERLKVIAMSDLSDYGDVNFISNQTLAPGMMFGRHPYLPNTYVDLNTFEDDIFKYTQLKMREIAFLLGATNISFTVKVLEAKKSEKNLHVEGNAKGAEVNIDAQKEEETKLKNKYSKSFEFTGQTDKDTYEKAKKFAEESGLMSVEDIEEMLMYHDPDLPSKELSREVTLEISKEFNSRLDIAATVDYLKIFNVKADYEEKFKIYNEYVYEAKFKW